MHRLAALVVVLASCGGSSKPKCLDCGAPMFNPGPDPKIVRQGLCDRAKYFQSTGCSPFTRMDPGLLADCSVADSIFIATIDPCMSHNCADMQTCATKIRLEGGVFRGPTTSCDDVSRESVPAGFDDADMERSTGRNDKTFADTASTPALPIEVCGMPDQLAYLTRVTCKDGSKPFGDRTDADHARVGNVGRAGRCQRVVDEYAVTCPEKTYQVFIDPYRCPRR